MTVLRKTAHNVGVQMSIYLFKFKATASTVEDVRDLTISVYQFNTFSEANQYFPYVYMCRVVANFPVHGHIICTYVFIINE